ncbi:MAG: hypothetical protein WBQ75_08980, partial [Acetobacteraceae bacterium]
PVVRARGDLGDGSRIGPTFFAEQEGLVDQVEWPHPASRLESMVAKVWGVLRDNLDERARRSG